MTSLSLSPLAVRQSAVTSKALVVTDVTANQYTDNSLAIELHETRKRNAAVQLARYQADTTEHKADLAQVQSRIAAVKVDIASIELAVLTAKRETDAVKATNQVRSMVAKVNLSANSANLQEAAVARGINKAKAQGITTEGTDYQAKVTLPTFRSAVTQDDRGTGRAK